MKKYNMYINGEWVPAEGKTYYNDLNPYSGEVFAQVADGGAEDVKKAVDAAQNAFEGWWKFPPSEKRKLFMKAADIFDRREDEILRMLAEETGAALPFAKFQTWESPEYFREAASQVYMVHGEILPTDMPGQASFAVRQPVGVVGSIGPWNASLLLAIRAIAAPLAYGNTVVLKTSEASSVTGGVIIAEVLEEAGFPKGVINLVTTGPGKSGQVGDVFTSDPRVKRISFTGSTSVGRQLAIQCAENLKRIGLELGGNCPLIILKDADLDYAVDAAIFGRFIHQGQICMNTKRIIVEEAVADEFFKKFVAKVKTLKCGDPCDPDTFIGPLINKSQLNELLKQIDRAKKQGAKFLCGGDIYEGLIYQPTVQVMTEDMDIAHEEVFGPVANVIKAKDADDALRIANNTQYGLSSAIITKDTLKAIEIAEKLEAGCCHINDSTLDDHWHAPFGGMKDSGYGNFGMESLNEFTQVRWVTLQKTPRKYF